MSSIIAVVLCGGEGRGWVGDVKRLKKAIGWSPRLGSREALCKTLTAVSRYV
jgi:hypothetical protein